VSAPAPQPASTSGWALLPAELALKILLLLEPAVLGTCAQLSRSFAALVRHPRLWANLCDRAWRYRFDGRDNACPQLKQLMLRDGCGSWRGLFLGTPRVRFGGVYVSTNFRRAAGTRRGGCAGGGVGGQGGGVGPKVTGGGRSAGGGSTDMQLAEIALSRARRLNKAVPHYRYLRFFPDGDGYLARAAACCCCCLLLLSCCCCCCCLLLLLLFVLVLVPPWTLPLLPCR
jgi:hypothetical protein